MTVSQRETGTIALLRRQSPRPRRIIKMQAKHIHPSDIILDNEGQDWEVQSTEHCRSQGETLAVTLHVQRVRHPVDDIRNLAADTIVRVRNPKKEFQVATETSIGEVIQRTPGTSTKAVAAIEQDLLVSAYPTYNPPGVTLRIGPDRSDKSNPASARWVDVTLDEAIKMAEDILEVAWMVTEDEEVDEAIAAQVEEVANEKPKGVEKKSKVWRIEPFDAEVHPAEHEGKVLVTNDTIVDPVAWFSDLAFAEGMVARLNIMPN